jgi:hypothetical protein
MDKPQVWSWGMETTVAVMLIGDVENVNKFEKQYQQYISYRDKLKQFRDELKITVKIYNRDANNNNWFRRMLSSLLGF